MLLWPVLGDGRHQKKRARKRIRALFLPLLLLYQFQPTHTANFLGFIFPADSWAYAENRQNGGLTRVPKIEKCAAWGLRRTPVIPLPKVKGAACGRALGCLGYLRAPICGAGLGAGGPLAAPWRCATWPLLPETRANSAPRMRPPRPGWHRSPAEGRWRG